MTNREQQITHDHFPITLKQLTDLVDAYKDRKEAEEVDLIRESYNGTQKILKGLNTSTKNGISTDSFQKRADQFGQNAKQIREALSFWTLCWEAMEDFTMRILLILGLICIPIGVFVGEHPEHDWIKGFAICIAVALVVNVTALNDYQKEKKFRELQDSYNNSDVLNVVRDGKQQEIQINDILVGDIVQLTTGLVLPCDGLLLKSDNIEMDEAAMTGENDAIHKGSIEETIEELAEYRQTKTKTGKTEASHHLIKSPIVLSGTTVQSGSGLMLVIAVGQNSAEGRLFQLATQEEGDTPMQAKLNKIALDMSRFGLGCATFALVAMFLRFGIEVGAGVTDFDSSKHVMEFVDYCLTAITVLVVAIPEGLPLAVTISLAYSVQKMQKENNLVKRMHACETMGGADMICSDKTGTLTTNDMVIAEFMVYDKVLQVEALLRKTQGSSLPFEQAYFSIVKEAMCANSGITFNTKVNPDTGNEESVPVGNRTEYSMVKFLQQFGHDDFEQTKNLYDYLKVNPFSSQRKKSSSVISLGEDGSRIHLKGASEWIFDQCKYILDDQAQPIEINESQRRELLRNILNMNRNGLRTICLAYLDVETDFDYNEVDEETGFPVIESLDYTCIGICGIKDPVRDEVPNAVKQCQRAGIKVRMITGDNQITARSIAKECNIIQNESNDDEVINGKEFYEGIGGIKCQECSLDKDCKCPKNQQDADLTKKKVRVDVVGDLEAFKKIVSRVSVMARSQPEHKYAMVTGLNQLGHVVAVTGDGTNDAPALKKADIGFAMGIQGTKLSKEVADIILLDDNFASIVVAAKWGRNIYDNIRKFIQFQLTANVVAVTAAIVGAITIKQSPLDAVQMLWVNLIINTFASLALATEEPKDKLLERPPQSRNESIVSKRMWKHILGQAFLQFVLMFVILFAGEEWIPESGDDDDIKTNGDYVASGRMYNIDGSEDYKEDYDTVGPSRHLTFLFNVFVFLQLFNELNSRRVHDQLNIFEGLWGNWLFIGIWLFTAIAQVTMVQVGGYAFSVSLHGLGWDQWLISFALGFASLLFRLLLLVIPERWFGEYGNKGIELQKPSLHSHASGAGLSRGNMINRLLRKATSRDH